MMRWENTQRQAGQLGVAAGVAALHLIAVVLLIRAFAPDLARDPIRPTTAAYDITVTAQAPPQPPPIAESQSPEPQGGAAPAGKRARPREVTAPRPAVVLSTAAAPPVAGTGAQDGAGAGNSGEGTGAGGSGSGPGGGGGAKAVKIAGDIVSARDYPAATRSLRLGSTVTIALSVDEEGRPSACRVLRPSRDPEADSITCRLALERFRFRPARNVSGQAIKSVFGWQQRWFPPDRE